MKHRYPSYPYVNYKEGTLGYGAMVAFLQDFSNQLEGRLEDDLVPVGEITERLNDLMAYTDAMAEAKATGVQSFHAKVRSNAFTKDFKRPITYLKVTGYEKWFSKLDVEDAATNLTTGYLYIASTAMGGLIRCLKPLKAVLTKKNLSNVQFDPDEVRYARKVYSNNEWPNDRIIVIHSSFIQIMKQR